MPSLYASLLLMNAGFPSRASRSRTLPYLLAAALACIPIGARADDGDEDASPIAPSASFSSPGYAATPLPDGGHRVQASFRSFTGDLLSIGFRLDPASSRDSMREFGISAAELDALMQACLATKHCNQAAFDEQTSRYYREHALRMRSQEGRSTRLFVDVAMVVDRNRDRVRPVAAALRKLAQNQGKDQAWAVEAAIALVQTGMPYRQPATHDEGRKIMGFYPPPRALERGYGDCDTKSALLAAILQNLTDAPIIGVRVPQHYLIGIAGTPREGQAQLSYGGKRFVLIEAAGPGSRPPGQVADSTQAALVRSEGVRVDPMF